MEVFPVAVISRCLCAFASARISFTALSNTQRYSPSDKNPRLLGNTIAEESVGSSSVSRDHTGGGTGTRRIWPVSVPLSTMPFPVTEDGNAVKFLSTIIVLGPTSIAEIWAAAFPEGPDLAEANAVIDSFKPTSGLR